jgi:hypothetical protein
MDGIVEDSISDFLSKDRAYKRLNIQPHDLKFDPLFDPTNLDVGWWIESRRLGWEDETRKA